MIPSINGRTASTDRVIHRATSPEFSRQILDTLLPSSVSCSYPSMSAAEVQAVDDLVHGKGRRLSNKDRALILHLHSEGRQGQDIAQIVGCNGSTVSRTIDTFTSTVSLARTYLDAKAVKMAQTVANSKDAATLVKVLQKVGSLPEDSVSTGVVVLMGNTAAPLQAPTLSPSVSLCKTPLTVDGSVIEDA